MNTLTIDSFLSPRTVAPTSLLRAKAAAKARRNRRDYFGEGLFSEPGWDLLLELFVAGEENKSISITSCCIAAGVPTATTIRWVRALEAQGLVELFDDARDGRRKLVRLTAPAHSAMRDYWDEQAPI